MAKIYLTTVTTTPKRLERARDYCREKNYPIHTDKNGKEYVILEAKDEAEFLKGLVNYAIC